MSERDLCFNVNLDTVQCEFLEFNNPVENNSGGK